MSHSCNTADGTLKPSARTLDQVSLTGATPTHCPYCALQCGMHVAAATGDSPAIVTAREFPTNRGRLCQKGWTAGELLASPERLTTPLARRSRQLPLEPVTWDEALDRVAEGLQHVRRTHGDDAVAVFGGGGLTNEKAYALGKFARVVLGTSNIDYNGRFCMSSAAAALNRAFGVDRGLPFPLTDLREADTVLVVGGNPAETMPPLVQHLSAQRDKGGALIVVDPRLTATARQASLHLQPTPGTDLALALGLLHLVIARGHVDTAYVDGRTSGFDAVRPSVASYWPQRVERITGVPVGQLEEVVRLLTTAERAVIVTARGPEQQSKGTDTVTAFLNLALALGLPGRPGSGFGCLTGQGNGQGGREHGQKADQLPGYRRIDDPAARAHVADVWGVDPDTLPGPGRSAYELLDSLGESTGPKALLVFGSNPAVSAPSAGRVDDRLAALDLLVVSDVVLSETACRADVVLPAAQWAEEDGTITNLEGRVLRRRRALTPPPGVRTDLETLAALSDRLSDDAHITGDPRATFDELRRASAGGIADYAGISWERIDAEDGVFWPCPSDDHPGTPRMFTDAFATPDGRARFVPVEHRPVAEDVDEDFPTYLTTGRVLAHYQSGAQTRRVRALVDAEPEMFIEIHPDLAAHVGLGDGDRARVVSRRGSTEGTARLTRAIRADTVFMPFHWSGRQRANNVTNAALDPVSKMPEFKVCAVRVEPAG